MAADRPVPRRPYEGDHRRSHAAERLLHEPGVAGGGRGAAPTGPETLSTITGTLTQLMTLLQGAEVTPTTQLVSAVAERRVALNKLLAQWTTLKAEARKLNLAP